jgi:outer membrane usher protein
VDAGGRKTGESRRGAIGFALAAALLPGALRAQAPAPSAPPAAATSAPAAVEPLVYAIQVNGRAAGDAVLLRLDGQRLLARESDWDAWHLVRPPTPYRIDGETYYALDEAPGFAATLDAQRQEARLQFAPQAFARSVLSARQYARVTPQLPPGLGGFLNYDFTGTRTAPDDAEATSQLGGIVETGLFNPLGVLTSQWLGRNLTDEPSPTDTFPRRVVRLETSVTRDLPDDMQTLRFGDAIGASGLWGRPVRFGGARWHRNFATQPGFVTLPQPSLAGETALPSVLDVYVDGMRRQSLEVPPGPFVVENLPTVTGQGEVQVVVRDLLGRETLLTDSYIAGLQQLRAGLADWSYEAGAVRENFGLESDDYGDGFAAGTHRYGFTDAFTGEARVEAQGSDVVAAGVGGLLAVPRFAVISSAVAVSHGPDGDGVLDTLALQHSSRRGVALGARLQLASEDFVQAGLAPGAAVPRRTFGANLGYSLRPLGRLGLAYVERDEAGTLPDFAALTGTLSATWRRASITLLAIDRRRPTEEWTVGLSLSVPFGAREIASTGHRVREPATGAGSTQSYARVQRNLTEQEGWGYRVMVSETTADDAASSTTGEAGAALNGPHGSYALEAATLEGGDVYRATVSGGLGALGGHVFASRKLSRSFAVVETGAEDIELLVNNRVAGRTDAAGVAVLPYLQPYQRNAVQVDATNVPLDVDVRSGEFVAAPYYRSGVLIPLDVRRARSAVVALRQADGAPVPSGAIVRLADGTEAPVGKHGQAYLIGLAAGDNAIEVRWNGTRCAISFALPADAGVQPQLGPFTCP